jgi:hypothetical protein
MVFYVGTLHTYIHTLFALFVYSYEIKQKIDKKLVAILNSLFSDIMNEY